MGKKAKSDFNLENILSNRSKKNRERVDGQITLQDWLEWKEDIRNRLEETAENFVVIGYRLKQIRDTQIFRREYTSLAEFAKKEYGLSETVVYRFIKINDKFSKGGNALELREDYRGYGYSKLQEMLYLTEEQLENVNPEMTVKEIRDLRSEKEPEECENTLTLQDPKVATSPGMEESEAEEAGGDFGEVPEELAPEQIRESQGGEGTKAAGGLWKEPKAQKSMELPPADAEYAIRASARLLKEIEKGLRFLVVKEQRQYRAGNRLCLEEFVNAEPTGTVMRVEISHLERDSGGIVPGWCVAQIEPLAEVDKRIQGQMEIEEMLNEQEEEGEAGKENGVYGEGQESNT